MNVSLPRNIWPRRFSHTLAPLPADTNVRYSFCALGVDASNCSSTQPVVRKEGADGIQYDVPGKLEQIRVALNEDRLEPTLEDVARSPVTTVELLRLDTIQLSHATRESWVDRLDEQVEGGWRRSSSLGANFVRLDVLAVGVTPPVEPLNDLREDIEEEMPVWIDWEDLCACVSATCDVVDRAGVLDTKWPSHESA